MVEIGDVQPTTPDRNRRTDLEHAHAKMMELPGAKEYGQTPEMIRDIIDDLDAQNMLRESTYRLALSDEEAQRYFSDDQWQPFKSKIEFSPNSQKRREQFLRIAKYLTFLEEDTRQQVLSANPEDRDKLQKALEKASSDRLIFYQYSLDNLLGDAVNALEDRRNGFNHDERSEGELRPTKESLELIDRSSREVADQMGLDARELSVKVYLALNHGDISLSQLFLENYQGKPEVRRVLERICEQQAKNPALTKEMIKLVWESVAYSLEFGVDLDSFLQSQGFPTSGVSADRLEQYLSRPDLAAELRRHIRRETEIDTEAQAQKSKESAILEAYTKHHEFPQDFGSTQERNRMVKEAKTEIERLFPLSTQSPERTRLEVPRKKGATKRVMVISYPNKKRTYNEIRILNPWLNSVWYRQDLAHEQGGHGSHRRALECRSRRDPQVSPTIWNELPSIVKEELALLVEDGMRARIQGGSAAETDAATQAESDREWTNLEEALLLSRRNVIRSLVQFNARKVMELRWQEGHRQPPDDDEAGAIADILQVKINAWAKLGVPIETYSLGVANMIEPPEILRGLKYAASAVLGKESQTNFLNSKTALNRRFGYLWFNNTDARLVIVPYLMALTADNHDISTYGKIVQETKISSAKQQLKDWGIQPDIGSETRAELD